ncbi:PREDICTED: protein PTCD3 homolog, mitochondrial [Ceratosolen solmsi marchali]|uniref:Protein PTCD3 homolog, mitochondrial n=1 Tax=Ceratosolen solmsi marchali TaxID=326594 RepID=A0AAJ6YGI6_9HYME|nr:PREDICTED: protein PTCD3 homolog, mitochondrial [Ceratosolen solmsi marchali]
MNSLRTRIVNRRNVQSMMRKLQPFSTPVSEKSSPEIKIPMRKERGPTDILRALEGTLLNDSTSNDYGFMDDPFFIPTSTKRKRIYALSKESGRRAARFIVENHSETLYSELSDPLIKAFLPPEKYTEKSQVSDEILMEFIKKGSVKDSLHIYELLEKNVKLETKQALLELLCFYNSEEQESSEDFPEELRYRARIQINKNLWNNNSEANSLFDELKNNEETAAAAYSAMICGTAKYGSVNLAEGLYKESLKKNLSIFSTCYHYLIQSIRFSKRSDEECKSLIEIYLKDMIQKGLSLNVDVLNAILSAAENLADNVTYATSFFSKFKSLGIEPTLTTYYYLLLILSKNNNYFTDTIDENVFMEILSEVKSKDFVLHDDTDQCFFSKAMSIAAKNYFPTNVGHEIYNIFLSKNKRYFLNNIQSNHFYNDYILMVLYNESLLDFQMFYTKFVPAVFIPDHETMKNIMENFLSYRKDNKLLPIMALFIKHIVSFEMLYNNNLLKLSLKAIVKHCTSKEEPRIQKELGEYASKVWTHLKSLHERVKYQVVLPMELYSNIIILLLYASEFEKALDVYDYLIKNPEKTSGAFKPTELNEIFNQCCTHNLTDLALLVLQYTHNSGIGDQQFYDEKIKSHFVLNQMQKQQLSKIIGS